MPLCRIWFNNDISISVFALEKLTDENITDIIDRALVKISPKQANPTPSSSPQLPLSSQNDPPSTGTVLSDKVKKCIVSISDGDARTALSLLELVLAAPPITSEKSLISILRKSVSTRYDRTGDSHYDMISALHKSVRGSDGSAALYWLARMLTAGEDPLYIARRLIVMASEDVGLANNHALPLVSRRTIIIDILLTRQLRRRPLSSLVKISECQSVELTSLTAWRTWLNHPNQLDRMRPTIEPKKQRKKIPQSPFLSIYEMLRRN